MDESRAHVDALPVDQAFAESYRELRRLAHARLRGSGPHTILDTTALVHEAYLKLSRSALAAFPDRAHFLGYAGKAMRSIIVDLVRQRQAGRHGGGLVRITLTGATAGLPPAEEIHILRVHEALDALQSADPRMAQVVELRYFAGFSDAEISAALGVTERTVRRDWAHARLLLADALS